MASSFTTLLGLELPVQGELFGTWGDRVNAGITNLLDTAIAGATTWSTDANITLSTTTGAANEARQAIILCTGARTLERTITAPAASKTYVIINATTGSQSVKLVGVGPTTGVVIPALSTAVVAWNGSDFVVTGAIVSNGKLFWATQSLTLAGTDATVMTFPTTSATIARTDAANTFAGTQAFTDVVTATLNTGQLAGFRNKIIGGDFTTNPWQRGTSFTAPLDATYSADRFIYQVNTDAVANILKTADAPTAAQAGVYTAHCLHHDVTTIDAAIAAGQYCALVQRIEGLNAASMGFGQAGTRTITLSFWVKSTKTGIFCVPFQNSAGNRTYVAEYTVNVTNTWEKKSVTLPVDTSGTWLYDTGLGISIFWTIAAGSTYHTAAGAWAAGSFLATANQVNGLDSTSNDFKLALIQLEVGSTATPFESTDVGNVLRQCQRYYFRIVGGTNGVFGAGYARLTTGGSLSIPFPVSMRSAPASMEQSGTATDYFVVYLNTAAAGSSVPVWSSASVLAANIEFTVAAVLTAGQGVLGRAAVTTAYLGFPAEL